MGFRTLEISNPAEIHVKRSQLEITEQGVTVMIPLEDLTTVICSGPNIRMSTMAQSQMAAAGISLMVINEKYHPSCIIMPIESNVRQTLVLRHQINMENELKQRLWVNLITQRSVIRLAHLHFSAETARKKSFNTPQTSRTRR